MAKSKRTPFTAEQKETVLKTWRPLLDGNERLNSFRHSIAMNRWLESLAEAPYLRPGSAYGVIGAEVDEQDDSLLLRRLVQLDQFGSSSETFRPGDEIPCLYVHNQLDPVLSVLHALCALDRDYVPGFGPLLVRGQVRGEEERRCFRPQAIILPDRSRIDSFLTKVADRAELVIDYLPAERLIEPKPQLPEVSIDEAQALMRQTMALVDLFEPPSSGR